MGLRTFIGIGFMMAVLSVYFVFNANAKGVKCTGDLPITWYPYEDPERCAYIGKEIPSYPKIITGEEFYEKLELNEELTERGEKRFSPPKRLGYGGPLSKTVYQSRGRIRSFNRHNNNE